MTRFNKIQIQGLQQVLNELSQCVEIARYRRKRAAAERVLVAAERTSIELLVLSAAIYAFRRTAASDCEDGTSRIEACLSAIRNFLDEDNATNRLQLATAYGLACSAARGDGLEDALVDRAVDSSMARAIETACMSASGDFSEHECALTTLLYAQVWIRPDEWHRFADFSSDWMARWLKVQCNAAAEYRSIMSVMFEPVV